MIELKLITEFPTYKIDENGNIYSKYLKSFLQPKLGDNGYYEVTLFLDGKRHYKSVHRLVAETFIPNPENKLCVNHIDGNKLNNNVYNLEWVTHSENTKHAFANNLIKPRGQSISKELQDKIISYNGILSQRKIAQKLNTTYSIVNTCLKNYNLCLS